MKLDFNKINFYGNKKTLSIFIASVLLSSSFGMHSTMASEGLAMSKDGNSAKAKNETAIAIGNNSEVSSNATQGVAIGENVKVGADNGSEGNLYGKNSYAIGKDINVWTNNTIAVGKDLQIGLPGQVGVNKQKEWLTNNVVIGNNQKISQGHAVLIGNNNESKAQQSIGIGNDLRIKGQNGNGYNIAVGYDMDVDSIRSIGVGYKVKSGQDGVSMGVEAKSSRRAIAIGKNAEANDWEGVAIGYKATIKEKTGGRSIAIGKESYSSSVESVTLGHGSRTEGKQHNIAIGKDAKTLGESTLEAVSIGKGAETNGKYTIALGASAKASNESATAIGASANALAKNSVAIGLNSKTEKTAENTVVLGGRATATAKNNVILGFESAESSATTAVGSNETVSEAEVNGIKFGNFAGKVNGITSVGAIGKERKIINVAGGVISAVSTDAVNGSQLFATNAVIGNTADSLVKILGGNAKVETEGKDAGKITMTDIGGTGANNINDAIAKVGQVEKVLNAQDGKIDLGIARSAALSALKPLQYDPLEPTQLMGGFGSYHDSQSVALGVAHYTNESTLIHAGVTFDGDMLLNVGFTKKFGYSDKERQIPSRYRNGPISSVYVMQSEVDELKAENQKQKEEIKELREMVMKLIEAKKM